MKTPMDSGLARARAQRAAAVARRQAAAKRRRVLALALFVIALVLAAVSGSGLVAWGWIAVPVVALGGVMILGARGAAQGRAHDRQMLERIARLKREARSGEHSLTPRGGARRDEDAAPGARSKTRARTPSRKRAGADAQETPAGASALVTGAAPAAEGPAASKAAAASARQTAAPQDKRDAPAAADETAAASSAPAAQVSASSTPEKRSTASADADPFAKPWTPMPVPAPSYAMKPLVQRRDLDTKALIAQQRAEVSGKVPYRPTRPATSPNGVPLTSAEVAAGGPVQFDVDEVLDRRRLG